MLRVSVVLFLLLACQSARALPVPPGAGWLDVSRAPYNVHPPKQTPAQVTRALKRALGDAAVAGKTVVLPDGVYTLTAPLDVRCALRGQSRTKTILRLAPRVPGFGDRFVAQSVVSLRAAPSGGNLSAPASLSDLSIWVESGNAGAIGVRLEGDTPGVVRRVSLRGDGLTGLDCHAPRSGFSLVQDVLVEGFDCGVEMSSSQEQSHGAAIFERLQLELQHRVGFRNGSTAFVRDLRSRNRVCALQNAGFAVVDVARLIGAGSFGLDNAGGQLVLRAVRSAGYGATLREGERRVTGDIAEYVSGRQIFRASGRVARTQLESARSLRLPERVTPQAPISVASDWVSVADFGAQPDDDGDDADAIQRALDSLSDATSPSFGKTTLFFPRASAANGRGRYLLSHSIRLRGNISRVEGNGATIGVCGALLQGAGALFVVEETTRGQLWLSEFGVDGRFDAMVEPRPASENGALCFLEHRSNAALIARDIDCREVSLYRAWPGAGDVFLENLTGRSAGTSALTFQRGQNVWARGLAFDGFSGAVLNRGARVWMLGLAVRESGTAVDNAGDCDLLGLLVQAAPEKRAAALLNRAGGRLWTTAVFHESGAARDALALDDEDQEGRLRFDALPRRGDAVWALSLRAGEAN